MKEDTPEGSAEEQDALTESGHEDPATDPAVQDTPGAGGGTETVPEKRYKDLQAAFTRVSQENSSMKTMLAELKGNVGALMATRQPPAEPEPDDFAILRDEKIREEILNNPAEMLTVVEKVIQSMGTKIARVLDTRDKAILERIQSVDPRRSELTQVISELRKDDRLAQLPDDALIAIAEREQSKPGARPRPVSGLSSGRGAPTKKEEVSIKAHPLFKKIYATQESEVI